MLIFIVLLIIIFVVWMCTIKARFVYTDSDAGYEVFTCLNEFEINHALELIELKKYKQLQLLIQNNPNVLREINNILGPDYVFQDYLLSIEKSAISTCHRDENGQLLNGQDHPAYTVLFYLEPMEVCLDVIRGSHKSKHLINVSRPLEGVKCKPGQAILFNADLIHSGSIDTTHKDNKRLQMKLIHKDDIGKISQFDDYHKVADASKSASNWYTKFMRDVTCTFPGFADITKNGENVPTFVKTIYKYLVYGGGDKYKLHDV